MVHTTRADRIEWDDMPTLAEAQCCDLKIEVEGKRYWVCRGGSEYFGSNVPMISVERLENGSWISVHNHIPGREIDIPDYIIPDAS